MRTPRRAAFSSAARRLMQRDGDRHAEGGDAVRFDGIVFAHDDPGALAHEARALALADARGKAEQLAAGSGVRLGAIRSITETRGAVPFAEAPAAFAMDQEMAAGAATRPGRRDRHPAGGLGDRPLRSRAHPAATEEHRKRFMRAVFEEIPFDNHGVAAVQPRDEYAPLVAIAEARGGLGSGWADSSRQKTPSSAWSVASVQVLGVQRLVERLRAVGAA